jgi:hypothetical protein
MRTEIPKHYRITKLNFCYHSPEYGEDTLADVLAEDKLCKELLHGGELTQARSHHQRYQVPEHNLRVKFGVNFNFTDIFGRTRLFLANWAMSL